MSYPPVPISAIFDIKNGATPASGEGGYWDGDVRWVTPADLGAVAGRYITVGARNISADGYQNCGTQVVPSGSLILSIRAPIGYLAIADAEMCFNQGCRGLVPRSLVRTDFAYWALLASRGELEAAGQGTTFVELGRAKLRAIRLPLPDLDTQNAIAAFLDRETARIDLLIAKKERQIALLAEKFDAQVMASVTRGLSSEPKRVVASSVDYLGDTPATWSIEPLGRRYSVQLGKMLDASRQTGDHLAPYLRVADVQWDEINIADLPTMDFDPSDRIKYRLKAGDLLVNEGGSYVGRSAIWRGEIEECFYQKALHRVRTYNPNRDTTDYLLWVMWFATKQGVFVARGNQTTIDHLTAEAFRRYLFAFPPIEEQRSIAEFLQNQRRRVSRLLNAIAQSINRLRERRAALITAAVTGQIEVRRQSTPVATTPSRDRFRIVVGAEIVQRHQGNAKFGRIKLQKELYLAEAHAGIAELQGTYLREAAGPLDRAFVEEAEGGMEASAFFRVSLPNIHAKTSGVTYTPLPKAGRHRAELERLLGPRVTALRQIIELLSDFDTRAVEAVATLYAVWNDALIDGETPDDDAIIRAVLNDWHPEKREKFKDADLRHWLDWMKRNHLVPSGKGPRTISTASRDLFS